MTVEPASTPLDDSCRAPNPREIERLAWISDFERTWFPVRELKPWHKEKLKRYFAGTQKQEGATIICQKCGKLCGFDGTQIHHPDHDARNNVLSNIRVYCDDCNEEEKKQWLRAVNSRTHAQPATLPSPKEKENEGMTASEQDKTRLLKEAPLTFQKSKAYKIRALQHLIEYFSDAKAGKYDDLAAEIAFVTGCSLAKAQEYLNIYSTPSCAPFCQYTLESGIAMVKSRDGWNEAKFATEEYKKAKAKLERRELT